MSILGTWHGGGESSAKWNAAKSTVQQVLISIQGLIMIEKPYFNEPAYDSEAGTPQGEAASMRYNESLRLSTARHAMLDVVRRLVRKQQRASASAVELDDTDDYDDDDMGEGDSDNGEHAFDDVLRVHFCVQKARLLAQLRRWHDEATDANKRKFEAVWRELRGLLQQLRDDGKVLGDDDDDDDDDDE